MSAIVCRDRNLGHLNDLLLRLRAELGRAPDHRLNWKNIKGSDRRRTAARLIGQAGFVKVTSVIVCKRHLYPPLESSDAAYLFTLRFLLERLSWLGRRHSDVVDYRLSHWKHFRAIKLGNYEMLLRAAGSGTEIDWQYLDPYGGRISNDRVLEPLQLADLAASATARAFEEPSDQTYLRELLPCVFRGGVPGRPNVLTSYGLKMHPWREDVSALYPWLLELR